MSYYVAYKMESDCIVEDYEEARNRFDMMITLTEAEGYKIIKQTDTTTILEKEEDGCVARRTFTIKEDE